MTEQIHIAVLTGKRGGYGAMKPMLQAMKSNEKIKLSLIVTDQHVNEKFGSTISEIISVSVISSSLENFTENFIFLLVSSIPFSN